jgi:hypothetical protein
MGTFRYDLPNRPIKIFITAAGFQPWEYTEPVTGNTFVKVQSHEHKIITVKLKPSTWCRFSPAKLRTLKVDRGV